MVRAEKDSVEQNRRATRANEAALREEWKNIDVVLKSFEQLETLAKKHKMADQTKIDTTNAKYQAAKCKTLVLKARSVENPILINLKRYFNRFILGIGVWSWRYLLLRINLRQSKL